MTTRIQKWGNSQGLRLSKQMLDLADITVGEDVEIIVSELQIVVKKLRRPKFDLAELVARIPRDYQDLFNQRTGLAIVCPVTNTDRGFPFHLAVPQGTSLTGFVMVEQVKSVDYLKRSVKFIEKVPAELTDDVLSMVEACLR